MLSTGSSISVESLNLEEQIEKQFAEHPFCPYCHNDGNIKRWGKRKGRQHYSCSGSNSTFSAFTNTVIWPASSRKMRLLPHRYARIANAKKRCKVLQY